MIAVLFTLAALGALYVAYALGVEVGRDRADAEYHEHCARVDQELDELERRRRRRGET